MSGLEKTMFSVADAEYLARRRLPRALANAIEIGDPDRAFARNLAAFDNTYLRPRAGVAFAHRDLRTTVLGHEIALPVLIAPTGNVRVFHPDAELGVARAAGAARTIHCVSSLTGHPIEEVTAAGCGPVFFQLYFLGGRRGAEEMIERASRSDCKALILTLDTAARPLAERRVDRRAFQPTRVDVRSALRVLPQVFTKPRWLAGFIRDGMSLQAPMARHADGTLWLVAEASAAVAEHPPVWEDLRWIREQWAGPIIVKGIVTAEDAKRAVAEGAAAIVVSNHGGHMLPSSPSPLQVLPGIAAAVSDEVEILFDSGIRRGEDVVKALARGARAVLIGRGYLWAHAAAGEAGVSRILDVFSSTIDQTLAFLGCRSVRDLDESYIVGDL